jgi:hypothetical protein
MRVKTISFVDSNPLKKAKKSILQIYRESSDFVARVLLVACDQVEKADVERETPFDGGNANPQLNNNNTMTAG